MKKQQVPRGKEKSLCRTMESQDQNFNRSLLARACRGGVGDEFRCQAHQGKARQRSTLAIKYFQISIITGVSDLGCRAGYDPYSIW
jgi:hypothetical protein